MISSNYPDKRFLDHFAPPSDKVANASTEMKNPENRPGLQSRLEVQPIDDIYANGKLCMPTSFGLVDTYRLNAIFNTDRGSGKLEGKVAWISGGDSGIGVLELP